MILGVLSDTHLDGYSDELAGIIRKHFRQADMILHAGDIVDLRVLDAAEGKPVHAVCGNMDPPEVSQRLPGRLLLELGEHRIGLIHGWGPPGGIEERLRSAFDEVDCIVYGHTHIPASFVRDGVLFFNPGSATSRGYTQGNTIGLLTLGKGIEGRIIRL